MEVSMLLQGVVQIPESNFSSLFCKKTKLIIADFTSLLAHFLR